MWALIAGWIHGLTSNVHQNIGYMITLRRISLHHKISLHTNALKVRILPPCAGAVERAQQGRLVAGIYTQ
jgi:hypothetical protein